MYIPSVCALIKFSSHFHRCRVCHSWELIFTERSMAAAAVVRGAVYSNAHVSVCECAKGFHRNFVVHAHTHTHTRHIVIRLYTDICTFKSICHAACAKGHLSKWRGIICKDDYDQFDIRPNWRVIIIIKYYPIYGNSSLHVIFPITYFYWRTNLQKHPCSIHTSQLGLKSTFIRDKRAFSILKWDQNRFYCVECLEHCITT